MKKRMSSLVVTALLASVLIVLPAAEASATSYSMGPYSSKSACNIARGAFRNAAGPGVNVWTCQGFANGWFFQVWT